jgi:hypothetical protein
VHDDGIDLRHSGPDAVGDAVPEGVGLVERGRRLGLHVDRDVVHQPRAPDVELLDGEHSGHGLGCPTNRDDDVGAWHPVHQIV